MKSTLLLIDETTPNRLMLNDVAFDVLPPRASESYVGCNCDRWGHPCRGCVNPGTVSKPETSLSSPVKP